MPTLHFLDLSSHDKNSPEYFVTFQLHDKYLIGSHGTVKSLFSRKANSTKGILAGTIRPDRYKMYYLKYMDGNVEKQKWFYGQILVAKHFVANPYSFPEVDHLDNDRSNNIWWNLMWTTHAMNVLNSYIRDGKVMPTGRDHWRFGKKASEETRELLSRAKLGIDNPRFKGFYWVYGKRYDSALAAQKATGINYRAIIRRCKALQNEDFWFERTEDMDLDAWR